MSASEHKSTDVGRHDTDQNKSQSRSIFAQLSSFFSSRSALTLTEALFAAGILTVGVLGIMSLVPAATHQVGSATGSTIGSNIARDALEALQNGRIAFADYDSTLYPGAFQFSTLYDDGTLALDLNTSPALPLNTYGSWPGAIAAIDDEWQVAPDTTIYGCAAPILTSPWLCYTDPSFRIPGAHVFTQASWDALLVGMPIATVNARPEFVPVPWADDYGWTATFLPVWADEINNNTGLASPDTNPDGTILPSTNYRVQIAIWRWHKWNSAIQANRDAMYDYKGTAQATFTAGSDRVDITSGNILKAHANGFIRFDDYGVWMQIARIGEEDGSFGKADPNPRVYLVAPFQHPGMAAGDVTPLPVNISMTSALRLVGLYEGSVTPPNTRVTP